MKKLFLLSIIGLFFIASCGGGGSGGSSTPKWVGTWLEKTHNGIDYEYLNITYTITVSSMVSMNPGVCAQNGPLTVSEDRFIWEIAATDCSNVSVGDVASGTFSVTGDWLTIISDGGSVLVLSRLSYKPEK